MVKAKTIFKVDHHSKAIQLSNNNPMVGGAVNLEGEVRTASDMMPIHRCLEMILLASK